MSKAKLKRTISFPMLLFYGLGTMVGGGFYALIGKVSGEAQLFTPLAFLLAGILALVNGFTYAELSSRYPESAGEAKYVDVAFSRQWFTNLVGFIVIVTGVVSAATLSVATIGFMQDLFIFPKWIGILVLVVAMAGLCIWGVGESVWFVLLITFIEVGALVFIGIMAGSTLPDLATIGQQFSTTSFSGWSVVGLLSGTFLSFYAFIGFEDMANMAEEVKNERKSLPKAMILSVLLATVVYVVISMLTVLAVPVERLAAAATPLAEVVKSTGAASMTFVVLVSVLTGINGALVQIIMASRVLYGMGKKSTQLAVFTKINQQTQTPILATIVAATVVLMLALFFPLKELAEITSSVILILFTVLNLALIKIKRKKIPVPNGSRSYPIFLPYLGAIVCISLLLFKLLQLSFFY